MARFPALIPALAAGALAAAPPAVQAQPRPLETPIRIDYQAAPGCPGEEVFVDEIRWRTSLLRLAAPGVEGRPVQARIVRRGATHEGRLVLGAGRDRIVRAIEGEVCDEVVSALALVTALAIDPRASTAPRPPPAPPSPGPGPLPPAAPPATPVVVERLPDPDIVPPPLPAHVSPVGPAVPEPAAPVWSAGAIAAVAFAVTARPIYAGGVFAERELSRKLGASLLLALEVGGTGAFDAGPGRVSFVRGVGRIEGCVFAFRPARWLSLVPCLAVEGGAIHGQGIPGGMVTRVQETTVPWAGLGVLARAALELGPVVLGLEGGPVFPLVRRTFKFDAPEYVIHDVPPVTGMVGLGGGVRFP